MRRPSVAPVSTSISFHHPGSNPSKDDPSCQGRLYQAQGLHVCHQCGTKFPCCRRKPGPWYLSAEKTLLLHMQLFHTSLHRSCDSLARALLCHGRNARASAEKFNWIFFVDYRPRILSYIVEKLSYLLLSSSREACANAGTELTTFSILKVK